MKKQFLYAVLLAACTWNVRASNDDAIGEDEWRLYFDLDRLGKICVFQKSADGAEHADDIEREMQRFAQETEHVRDFSALLRMVVELPTFEGNEEVDRLLDESSRQYCSEFPVFADPILRRTYDNIAFRLL